MTDTTTRVGPDSTRADLEAAIRAHNARAHAATTHDDRVAAVASRDKCLDWWANAKD